MKKLLLAFASVLLLSMAFNTASGQTCLGFPNEPGSDWAVPNASLFVSDTTVTIFNMAFCNKTTATPPWTSTNYIFQLSATYRPSATRIFNANDGAGATYEVTVQPNGNFYIRHLSGPIPGRGGGLVNGSYSL